jgi:outer membrane protein OmpA-like peptidoglycan-associated protein
MRALLPALAVAALCASGCPSTYQRTYDAEIQRLEAEQRVRDEQQRQLEEAQRQEAHKYVAIVLFAVNSSEIDDAGFREIDWFLEKISPYPHVQIDIKGYTDSTGSEAHNQPLSNKRAWAVQDYLVARGVSPDHISAGGYGDAAPAEPNVSAKGRQQNRRAELRVR